MAGYFLFSLIALIIFFAFKDFLLLEKIYLFKDVIGCDSKILFIRHFIVWPIILQKKEYSNGRLIRAWDKIFFLSVYRSFFIIHNIYG